MCDTASSLQVCCDGRAVSPLETWVQQTQLHRAHRTCGASRYIPSRLAALLTCCCPRSLSTQGKSVVLEGLWPSTFCSLESNPTCTDTAHVHTARLALATATRNRICFGKILVKHCSVLLLVMSVIVRSHRFGMMGALHAKQGAVVAPAPGQVSALPWGSSNKQSCVQRHAAR